MEANSSLNPHHIIDALRTIQTQRANWQEIRAANDFLDQCETHPDFTTTILAIYSESSNYQLQLTSMILLTNVIKRNWNPKRSMGVKGWLKPQVKTQLRQSILKAYFLHELCHYKHFNALIAFLTRMEYPLQQTELHQFMTNSLSQLAQMIKSNLEVVLNSPRVLAVLSTCKTIMKEYNQKKAVHKQQIFLQYATNIMEIGMGISQELYSSIKNRTEQGNLSNVPCLLEYLRKIDKFILYGLGSMPQTYQYKPEVKSIIHSFIYKLNEFDSFFAVLVNQQHSDVCEQLQKYFIAVIQQLTKLQNTYAFILSDVFNDYLFLILRLLVQNVPKQKYYQSQKLLSVIVLANIKHLTIYAYHTTNNEYKNSIYAHKQSSVENLDIQKRCNQIFRELYTPETVVQLLKTLLTEVMTAPHVLKDYKVLNDNYVLEDVDITIVENPAEASVYENCICLAKSIIKRFKAESSGLLKDMIEKVQELKYCRDRYNHQVLVNILEIIIILPTVYDELELPINQICNVINSLYEINQFSYLSRMIRSYHQVLPLRIAQTCFEILARVVATPINGSITYEIIYQAALGLKTLMKQMQAENIPIDVLTSCVGNLVSLANMKEFIECPTLMWPIVNLLIKFGKTIHDLNRPMVEEVAKSILLGLSSLIYSERNEESLFSALAELISSVFFFCFKAIKLEFPLRGKPITLTERMMNINKSTFVAFDAGLVLINCNIHNRFLENSNTIYRFWLTLMRSYPSLYSQKLYGFELEATNSKLIEMFKALSKEMMVKNAILCVQILEEYFITQLIDLSGDELSGLISSCLEDYEEEESRVKLMFALASLYFSFSLLRAPRIDIALVFVKELVQMRSKVSPGYNTLRTLIFLMLGSHFLNNSTAELYNLITNCFGGSFESWFFPYLTSMRFVSSKCAFKINSAVLLKTQSDIGLPNFSQLLLAQQDDKLAISHYLRIVILEAGGQNLDVSIGSYDNIYRFLAHQLTPEFEATVYRKARLHLSDDLLQQMVEADLTARLKQSVRQLLTFLNWSTADLHRHLGQTAMQICILLGWEAEM